MCHWKQQGKCDELMLPILNEHDPNGQEHGEVTRVMRRAVRTEKVPDPIVLKSTSPELILSLSISWAVTASSVPGSGQVWHRKVPGEGRAALTCS